MLVIFVSASTLVILYTRFQVESFPKGQAENIMSYPTGAPNVVVACFLLITMASGALQTENCNFVVLT
ncbi:hypothetical protein CYMTET_4737 [Cymbomonas tetramitiformis]|uniref:Uncharacterized protein n=1 Tax=Cymbomonas tetramitiformis TaxID=36881 RepID=A0AAE0H0T9_9CHLO|nr:hypothetical protein CYMTET_4737 [Cymbomonas tetramitiformis]